RLASEPPSQVLEFVVGDAWIGGQQRFDALQGRRSLLDFAGHGRVRHGQLTSTMTRNASPGNARIAPITAESESDGVTRSRCRVQNASSFGAISSSAIISAMSRALSRGSTAASSSICDWLRLG